MAKFIIFMLLAIGVTSGESNDMADVLRRFITEKENQQNSQTSGTSTTTPRTHCCPEGWWGDDASCYLLVSEKKTWKDARQYCNDRDADFLSIDKISHKSPFREFPRFEHITLVVAFYMEKVWINADNFVFAGDGLEDCPSATPYFSEVYTWDYDCNENYSFICKM